MVSVKAVLVALIAAFLIYGLALTGWLIREVVYRG